ncbi:uncharacterized protein LOC132723987 [Ruditapes philippinarum]|uniref:uncharacterized protein LOC132723987 n=1 Tax=Ruditapes philippinarum TaxID=129788 RepID=UPI00295A8A82|nr:uncharacterized protein LOC132723987 [Ruditapes philippinarum]
MFYQTEDLTTLKMFDLLFFISLKETDTHECHINKMIYHMLQKSMPDPNIYSRRFLDKILLEKNVLIILDGLDEWMHPENCEHMGDVIPHRRHWPNCTILTSTRPWKLYSSKIQNSQIDMLSELLEFDETKSNQLLASALKLFNRAYMTSKKVEDFRTAVSSLKVDVLRSIPYIFLQLICLWFDDYTIGNSQCQIYSNTIELNLVRGKSFTDVTVTETASNESVNHPVCLSANKECLHHYQQLLRLGKLAFETLTSGRNESALIFDDHIVNKFISTDEQRFLLNKGLLSQNKDFRKVSERKSNFSFQHKTIQEYFAALYIQSSPHNPDLKKRLLTEYSTLESILQLSNMFVFLGGFSPVAYQNISDLQRSIMSTDETISRFRCRLSGRTSLPENRKCWEDVKSFQSMQTDILQEMLRNNHRDYYLYLEDVVLDNSITYKRFKTLVKIIQKNTNNIKSLSIEQSRSTKEVSDRLSKLDLPNLKLLQKLEVIATPPINYLKQLLTNSEKSLKCLDLCFANFIDGHYRTKYTKLPREIIRTVFGMELLTSLRLNSIRLTHTDIQNLLAHINGKSEMTEIGLCHIECEASDHSGECGVLDLSGHKNLQTLRLGTIPISTLRVNPSVLNMCYTGRLSTNVHMELDGCLSNAANLGTLRLKYLSKEQVSLYTAGSLKKLAQMKSFAIEYADFGDRKFVLTPEMRSIERVHLYEVTLTTPALEELIRSVDNLSKAVLIIIESCDIIPSCCLTYHMITNKIRKSTKYRVRFDSKKKFSFETGYANFEAKDAWVSGLFMVAGLVGAILGVLAMFLFVFQ